ncbi:MAG TPA: hypothetical protein VIR77_01835 [Pontiella sp.]
MHKNQIIRIVIAALVVTAYLVALRFVLPAGQPCFILGIGVVGFAAWLSGTFPGLAAAFLLIPATNYVYEQLSVYTTYTHFLNSAAYLGLKFFAAFGLGYVHSSRQNMTKEDRALRDTNKNLYEALSHVQELGGVHSLCGECKKILTDEGVWQDVDIFLHEHTKMEFSHCICTECAEQYHAQLQAEQSPKA